MTIDRAIEILNPEHREQYDSLETVKEACRMGMEALKKQKDYESEIQKAHEMGFYEGYAQAVDELLGRAVNGDA